MRAERSRLLAEVERLRALIPTLHDIYDNGYQPGYNGRPSCPFCGNFIDDEETHSDTCELRRALLDRGTTEITPRKEG
jgi:hypothetical protein